jgi:hypothetical protein
VYGLATSSDGSTVYVGGAFSSINGSSRGKFAAVSASGSLLPWKSNANGGVRAIAVSGTTVYLGGAFRTMQGQSRLGLAAIDGGTGSLLPWSPAVTNPGSTSVPTVRGLAAANGDVVAVGKFDAASGPGGPSTPEPDQARFDAATGALKTWVDNYAFTSYGIVTDGSDYFVGAGGPGGSVIRYSPSGVQRWRSSGDGDVQAVGLFDGKVLGGGHFTVWKDLNGVSRDLPKIVALDPVSGAPDTTWAPRPNGVDSGVWAIHGSGALYIGGGFTAVGGSSKFQKFAAFTGSAPIDGEPPTPPTDLSATAPSSTRVDLSWTASHDNVGVTAYDLYRNAGTSPIATTTPQAAGCSSSSVCTLSDTTVVASTPYTYTVVARDFRSNTSQPSNTASVTTPAGGGGTGTFTFPASADAKVLEANPSTNSGLSTTLKTDGGSDPDIESYLRFDVTGLSGAATSAKLRVCSSSDGTQNGPAAYSVANNSWGETTITWNMRPARGTTAFDDKGSVSANTCVDFDVSSLVPGNGTYSFALATDSSDGVSFNSREVSTNPPALIVTG